jgi:hypothetical protein
MKPRQHPLANRAKFNTPGNDTQDFIEWMQTAPSLWGMRRGRNEMKWYVGQVELINPSGECCKIHRFASTQERHTRIHQLCREVRHLQGYYINVKFY